jgi:pimeloyl-ACP methyl ester carboxylesterase
MMIAEAKKLAARLSDVRAPTMILAGADDRIVRPPGQAQRLHRALDDSELRTLPGVGHMLHHTDPMAVASAVEAVERKAARGPGKARALVPDAAALLPQDHADVRASG